MNLRCCLIILLSFLFSISNAQDSSTQKFSIGLMFSPDYTYRNSFATGETTAQDENFKNINDELEIGMPSFSTGLCLEYQLNHLWSIETGARYAERGEKTLIYDLLWIDPNDPSILGDQVRYRYSYKFIDIPLKVKFHFGSRKLSYFVSAGASLNLLQEIESKLIWVGTEQTESSYYDIETFNKVLYSVNIGVGIKYSLTDHLNIRLEPTFQHAIKSFQKGSGYKRYHYSVGANFGVYFAI